MAHRGVVRPSWGCVGQWLVGFGAQQGLKLPFYTLRQAIMPFQGYAPCAFLYSF